MVSRTANGNVYLMATGGSFDIAGDTLTADIIVEIDTQKVEDILTNELISFPIPRAPAAKTTDPPEVYIIDLKRIKAVLSIQGALTSDSNESAFAKKQNLFTLSGLGGYYIAGSDGYSIMSGQSVKSASIVIVWGLSSESKQQIVYGNIQQISVTEIPGQHTDGTADTMNSAYTVQLKITVGKERG